MTNESVCAGKVHTGVYVDNVDISKQVHSLHVVYANTGIRIPTCVCIHNM